MPRQDDLCLVLLGAGHANLLAVQDLRDALPQARITLIDAASEAIYSGMFPGLVAGHYAADALRVDLATFAARHQVRFIRARITGLDPAARRVMLSNGRPIAYDLAALDVGSHTAMPEMPGFTDHGVPIKPWGPFEARLSTADPAAPAAVIGGGVAGAEIALALTRRQSGSVALIEAGPSVGASLQPRTQARLRDALDRAGVRVVTRAQVAAVEARAIVLGDGRRIDSALSIGIAGARAHDWQARDLPVDNAGFVRVAPTLQVEGHPALFAAGDCAAMCHAPRPKAGVFAVRQAPVLAANLIAAHRGTPMCRHDPQRDYLKIISLGRKAGPGEWHGLTLHGVWLWHLKDRIDRRFMQGLQG